jgi:hypothetical protein
MKANFGLFTAFAAATLCAHAGAAALTPVGNLDAAVRPAGVPLNYVATPNGFFHPSCVVALAESDTLAANGDVVHAGGKISHTPACAYPRYGAQGQVLAGAQPDFGGWIIASDSDSDVTPPAKKMASDFVVPSGPTANVSQILYFFPGLEDGQNVITILQPVLAWNGFSDHRWTMTDWNCCSNGTSYHGSTIPVSTGDKIRGTMAGSKCSGDVCNNWKIVSTDMNTSGSTTFKTIALGQAFTWYFGGVLEAYGVSACTHFPSNGEIDFTKDKVMDMDGNNTTPDWLSFNPGNGAPACNFVMTSTSPKNTTLSWKTSN